jgi:hypothetical protein
MIDQREPHTKPHFTPKLVGWVVASGAAAAIAAVLLIAAAPPSPYSNLLTAVVVAAVVIGAVIFLTGVVMFVCEDFGNRHDRIEQATDDFQQQMSSRINELIEYHKIILLEVRDLHRRAQEICGHQEELHTDVDQCMSEVSLLTQGLSELREAFVEEGLPGHPEQLRTGGAGQGPRRLNAVTQSRFAQRSAQRRTGCSSNWTGTT